jgi:hypothetical protein
VGFRSMSQAAPENSPSVAGFFKKATSANKTERLLKINRKPTG